MREDAIPVIFLARCRYGQRGIWVAHRQPAIGAALDVWVSDKPKASIAQQEDQWKQY